PGHHQHLPVTVWARRRRAGDFGEWIGCVALDVRDHGDRQSRWIDAVDSGSHQHVAVLDIGVDRHETQVESTVVADAEQSGALPGAHDLHRYNLLAIADQRHFRGPRESARDLPD